MILPDCHLRLWQLGHFFGFGTNGYQEYPHALHIFILPPFSHFQKFHFARKYRTLNGASKIQHETLPLCISPVDEPHNLLGCLIY